MTEQEIEERKAEAGRRLRAALETAEHAEARLSDVIHDAHDYRMHEVHDGFEFDGDEDHGYDSDELAAVLLTLLVADRDAELSVNVEPRRAGEVAVGVLSDVSVVSGFAWVPAQDARDFAFRLLGAARDSDDMAAKRRA